MRWMPFHRAYYRYLDEIPPQLDPLIQEWLVPEVFARKFVESNLTLASFMEFFSKPARQKLIDVIAATETRQFESRAAKSITEALNKSTSRNVYTDALAQYLIDHPSLRRKLAGRRGDMPEVFARRLQAHASKKAIGRDIRLSSPGSLRFTLCCWRGGLACRGRPQPSLPRWWLPASFCNCCIQSRAPVARFQLAWTGLETRHSGDALLIGGPAAVGYHRLAFRSVLATGSA